jgi:hypothetical protein
MKFADGNSQLGSGKYSIATPSRRNIPMTGAKYGCSAERIFNTHNMTQLAASKTIIGRVQNNLPKNNVEPVPTNSEVAVCPKNSQSITTQSAVSKTIPPKIM